MAAEVDQHDVVGIESDISVADVRVVQFYFVMCNTIILLCNRLPAQFAYDLPVFVLPLELQRLRKRDPPFT